MGAPRCRSSHQGRRSNRQGQRDSQRARSHSRPPSALRPALKRLRQRSRPRIEHLRRLTGRDWGLQEQQPRVVANGYVRGSIEHAAAAWLPAASASHVEVLEPELRAAARAVTGCPRSTPSHALSAEAGIIFIAAEERPWRHNSTPRHAPDPGGGGGRGAEPCIRVSSLRVS